MIRELIANSFISAGRLLGKSTGLELAVTVSEHSIDAHMVQPKNHDRDWDSTLYKSGNLFFANYANPIKPYVTRNIGIDELDEVDVEHDEAADSDAHVGMKSSKAYVESIEHNAVSQLLNPKERWQLIAYGMIGLGVIQFLAIIIVMYVNGAF